jgi:VIT1/CCC1 family predicted Fe2+/Mn2+ transporter
MGTKTADETGAETGAETRNDEEKVDVTKTDEVTATEAEDTVDATEDEAEDALDETEAETETETEAEDVVVQEKGSSDVGQGAGAIVSAALGLVSLTGSWLGTVASARENLIGQMQNSQSQDLATLVKEGYGDGWNITALYGGVFALVALLIGVVVLARPAFGAPGKPQAAWIKSVSWAGVALGVIGLLLAVLKYTDVLVGLPSTS